MADPGYDFFATAAPAGTAVPEPPATNRFGGPVEPAATPAGPGAELPPAAPATGAPALSSSAEPEVPTSVPGYHPGSVNRFGTPADLAAVPTGPYAAPGLGAAPIEAPGLVSTWSGPATAGSAAAAPARATEAPPAAAPSHDAAARSTVAADAPSAYGAAAPVAPAPAAPVAVSRFGSPIPPDVLVEDPSYAALAFGAPVAAGVLGAPGYGGAVPHGHRPAQPVTPGTVRAAGIIGIVEGGLLLLIAVFGVLGYLALKSQADLIDSSPQLAASGLSAAFVSSLLLVASIVWALMAVGYLAAGIATVRGRRWGAWALLVVSSLSVLYGLYQVLTGHTDFGTLLSLGVSGAVVVLIGLPDSMAWLRRR